MTLQEFAEVTIEVLKDDGLEEYLPTVAFPKTRELRVISDIPEDLDHREAIQNLLQRGDFQKTEFFFGVRSGPNQVTIGHSRPNFLTKFLLIQGSGKTFKILPSSHCSWWKLDDLPL
ncbi:MAG: hypothetical protein SFY81_10175 [Verrucomicrobiota bacterium]|nr:hypothetical protein [Verrucomicrobiota bacterium]